MTGGSAVMEPLMVNSDGSGIVADLPDKVLRAEKKIYCPIRLQRTVPMNASLPCAARVGSLLFARCTEPYWPAISERTRI